MKPGFFPDTEARATCRIIAIENYNELHLPAAIELARSGLAGHRKSMVEFYRLLTNKTVAEDHPDIEALATPPRPNTSVSERIRQIEAIPLEIPSEEEMNTLRREYALFEDEA